MEASDIMLPAMFAHLPHIKVDESDLDSIVSVALICQHAFEIKCMFV
jgi:hypothetical protein